MELIIKYLGIGKFYKFNINSVVALTFHKFEDINKNNYSFFKFYPLHGCKQFDYLKLCKVAKLITKGHHLTKKGFDLIKAIKY
jgi:hypothetical protein